MNCGECNVFVIDIVVGVLLVVGVVCVGVVLSVGVWCISSDIGIIMVVVSVVISSIDVC